MTTRQDLRTAADALGWEVRCGNLIDVFVYRETRSITVAYNNRGVSYADAWSDVTDDTMKAWTVFNGGTRMTIHQHVRSEVLQALRSVV